MLSKEDNETLTQVHAHTPMGKMLRAYWHPAVRSERLTADGAPVRVRMLGVDGRVGMP